MSLPCKAWDSDPAGVREQGIGTTRFPRNLGDPTVADPETRGVGLPQRKAPVPVAGVALQGSENRRTGRSPSGEGNEACRVGRSEVGSPHGTAEAGELTLENPVEERG